MLCLAPMGAWGAPFTGGIVGNGGEGNNANGFEATDGIEVSAMEIGVTPPETLPDDNNVLYAGTNINKGDPTTGEGGFTITSRAEIKGGALRIYDGYVLNIQNTLNSNINMTFSSIDANGYLTIRDANVLSITGTSEIDNGVLISAQSMTTGDFNINGGASGINVENTLQMAALTTGAKAGAVDITAGNVNIVGDLVHSAAAEMDINATAEMDINAGDITVGGTVTNGNNGGAMSLTAANLTVNGGSVADGSFVNSGDLTIVVSGTTKLEYGFNLAGMGVDNTFSLTTGALEFGENASPDMWASAFTNKLNSFTLKITGSDYTIASNVINGITNEDTSNPTFNSNANMTIVANALTIGSATAGADVINYGGNLTLKTPDTTADGDASIEIYGDVVADATNPDVGDGGRNTTVNAATDVIVHGDVTNAYTMQILGGGNVVIGDADVTGSGDLVNTNGGTLTVQASTNAGSINIAGNVTNNSGTTNINAQKVTIAGALISDGTIGTDAINFTASDSNGAALSIGSIAANGGTINLQSLTGGVAVTGGVSVTRGVLQLGNATTSLTAGDSIDIGGNVIAGVATDVQGGDVVVGATGVKGQVSIIADNSDAPDGTNSAALNIDGNITNIQGGGAHSLLFAGNTITVGGENAGPDTGNVTVAGGDNSLTFGNDVSQQLTIVGAMSIENGAKITLNTGVTNVGTVTVGDGSVLSFAGASGETGTQLVAKGAIDVADGLWWNGANATNPGDGVQVDGNMTKLTLQSNDSYIDFGGAINVGSGKTLTMSAAKSDISVGGAVTNAGTLNASALVVEFGDVGNSGTVGISATNGDVTVGAVTNSSALSATASQNVNMGALTNNGGTTTVNAGTNVKVGGDLDANAGTVDITAGKLLNITGALDIASDATVNVNGDTVGVGGAVNVKGDVVHGTNGGALNFVATATEITAQSLAVTGDYSTTNGTGGIWNLTGGAQIDGDVTVADNSLLNFNVGGAIGTSAVNNNGTAIFNAADAISVGGDISNAGTLTFTGAEISLTGNLINTDAAKEMRLNTENGAIAFGTLTNTGGAMVLHAANGIEFESIVSNAGELTLDSGAGITNITDAGLTVGDTGTITLDGAGLDLNGDFNVANTTLYQNYVGTLSDGMINVASDDYTVSAQNFVANAVNQESGKMVLNVADVKVTGDINAVDLRFAKNPANNDNWLDVSVGGNVSGGVDFWGIKNMTIGGDYTFNNSSDLWAAVMPNGDGLNNTTTKNYWATIEATDDNPIGVITNAGGEDAEALITVGGEFISEMSGVAIGGAATEPQVGISLFETVDQGTAIWLLHATDGIQVEDAFDKLRNLDVKFCNADSSLCIDYVSTLKPGADYNGSDSELPIYITERDTDGDGLADSLYIVFDPAFGGPIEVFKLQPLVAQVPHTTGEYVSAGALDNLIAGQVANKVFDAESPIEVIPVVFQGTAFQVMADELYDRMEYYSMTGERDPLARFSRLFQARELEQIAGAVALNEHTNFRDFEDRMFDEFIWNRNRSLKKAWLDVDYGLFSQNVSDGKRTYGDRFSVAGGFDWQESETMILGLTARVSNSSSDNSDSVELGYLPQTSLMGNVDMSVDDLNIGLGGYLMKTLGEKTRVYGNAFLDVHMFDISRDQTFMGHIDGDGTAFSLISEWGLLHDWLNQYIVGNAYARVGYNFGFDVTEYADGQDYMNMQSDGYLILTPGYSLIAQKRIYPSMWFQIRPYASIGVEYDVLGAPDSVKYKFAPAHMYTKYDVDIDPLWANIGGGVELLSASGLQFGIDYRYQYNDAIQLHNIKVTGSYRF